MLSRMGLGRIERKLNSNLNINDMLEQLESFVADLAFVLRCEVRGSMDAYDSKRAGCWSHFILVLLGRSVARSCI